MKIPDDITDRIHTQARVREKQATWGAGAEDSFLLVVEAQRRFLEITQDQRQANTLTLAWAMAYAGWIAGTE
jgi:hypothetical protein